MDNITHIEANSGIVPCVRYKTDNEVFFVVLNYPLEKAFGDGKKFLLSLPDERFNEIRYAEVCETCLEHGYDCHCAEEDRLEGGYVDLMPELRRIKYNNYQLVHLAKAIKDVKAAEVKKYFIRVVPIDGNAYEVPIVGDYNKICDRDYAMVFANDWWDKSFSPIQKTNCKSCLLISRDTKGCIRDEQCDKMDDWGYMDFNLCTVNLQMQLEGYFGPYPLRIDLSDGFIYHRGLSTIDRNELKLGIVRKLQSQADSIHKVLLRKDEELTYEPCTTSELFGFDTRNRNEMELEVFRAASSARTEKQFKLINKWLGEQLPM